MVPELPRELDAIVRRGLSREPSERYATAREMAQEIEKCVPAVRASEVGAWVKQIARDSLTERETVLAEIERAAAENVAASNEPTPTRGTALIAPAVTLETDPGKGRRRTAWVAAFFAAGVALLALLATRHAAPASASDRTPAPSPAMIATGDPEAPAMSGMPIAADAVLAASASAPVPADTAAPVASSVPSASSPPAVALVPPLSSSPAPPSARPAHAPTRPPHRSKRTRACDPPYSIDAEGREIFKPECM